jgi:type I site-specific restriction endonuclease
MIWNKLQDTAAIRKVSDGAMDISHAREIEKATMNMLKDFQRETVNRIEYLFRNGQKRVLVADEVGLGKTFTR